MRVLRRVVVTLLFVAGILVAADEPAKQTASKPPYQRLLQGDDAKKAAELNKRIAELRAKDQYAEAIKAAQELLALRHHVQGSDHHEAVTAQWGVTALQKVAGLTPEKRSAYETAGRGDKEADQLEKKARFEQALPLRQRVLEQRRQVLGEEHPLTATNYNNVAFNLAAQGKHAAAEPLFRKALAIRQNVLGEEHPHTATSYNNVAMNLAVQGKPAAAEPLVRKALAIRQNVLGEEHPNTAQSYCGVAQVAFALGHYAEAVATGQRATRSFAAARLVGTRAGLDRALFTATGGSPYPVLAVAQAHLQQPEQAWQSLEAYLGRALLDALGAALPPRATVEERQQQQQLQARLAELAPQVLALVTRKDASDDDRRQLDGLLQKRTRLESNLADLAVRVAARDVAELAAVQAQLPTDAALLAWVDVQGPRKAEDAVNEHWACLVKKEGAPLWLRLPGQGANGAWTKDDDTLLPRLREMLSLRGLDPTASKELPDLIRTAVAQRLTPLEPHLQGIKQLIVLSAGWMAKVPLEALTDRYTISYAPSHTIYARFREQRPKRTTPPKLLAMGDPTFPRLDEKPRRPLPTPPEHGLLVTLVVPGSNAARSGLRSGDVLLHYGKRKLTASDSFQPADGTEPIPVNVWRDGQTLDLKVQPGLLGVMFDKQSAAAAILAQRATAEALERSQRADVYTPLPGTRREVAAIGKFFEQSDTFLGSEASELKLEELARSGALKQYRYLHFATHGQVNWDDAMKSALILAQDNLPDKLKQSLAGLKIYDGKLDVREIVDTWELDADLVTLSACETGLGQHTGGDGLLGFSQAILSKGARSLVVSLWKVDDTATALLMTRFYENLLKKRLPKAEALREAKKWLRELSTDEAKQQASALPRGTGATALPVVPEPATPVTPKDAKPYAHPYFWSAFILIGDAE